MARIREANADDAQGIARVHVKSWQSTYSGLLPDDFLASLSVERRKEFWARILSTTGAPEFTYVAEEDGQIIGFASGGPERENHPLYKGELYAIYLLSRWQGQGVGRLLARSVVTRLLSADIHTMMVWVLSTNGSRGFYERLGGKLFAEKPITIGDATVSEVAYGWEDLDALNAKLGDERDTS
jgi:L-amino acid N-acyltransferase YncA